MVKINAMMKGRALIVIRIMVTALADNVEVRSGMKILQKTRGWLARLLDHIVKWFLPRYFIRIEPMGGVDYHMIYRKQFGLVEFFERWNTELAATFRVTELNT